jgi:hypothetical protein
MEGNLQKRYEISNENRINAREIASLVGPVNKPQMTLKKALLDLYFLFLKKFLWRIK